MRVPAQRVNGQICCYVPRTQVAACNEAHVEVHLKDGTVAHTGKAKVQDQLQSADDSNPQTDAPVIKSPSEVDGDSDGRRTDETRKQYIQREYGALKPFAIISCSYLLFTITDGAVRLIVLLHAYQKGFTAWEVAIMFTLYELMGVVTNLAAGLAGAKWGIKWTLLTGLMLQLGGLGMLFGWQDAWPKGQAIIYVTLAQMLCGIAKDLTKLGGKTVTKLVTPEEKQARLFKLVSFITGMKNSLKGFGYFLGSVSLLLSYQFALALLCVLILLAMPWAALGLSRDLGRTRSKNLTLKDVFHQTYNVGMLSLARLFLFGSRDLWFEVPLPFFMRNTLEGLGWPRPAVGAFLAVFIILYGQVQSWTPQAVLQPLRQSPPNKWVCLLWNCLLTFCPAFLGIIMLASNIFEDQQQGGMVAVLVVGLLAFCLLFAINSSIHSYLVVRYSEGDKVATTVGFYYMSNAAGRLIGTLASGALYSFVGDSVVQGFGACFMASVGFCIISTFITIFLRDNDGGLACGRFWLVHKDAAAAGAPMEQVTVDKGAALDPADAGQAPAVQMAQPRQAANKCCSGPSAGGCCPAPAAPPATAAAAAAAAAAPTVPQRATEPGNSALKAAVSTILHSQQLLENAELRSKTVLLRADLNVPLTKDGHVSDDWRILASVKTVELLVSKGARVALISHLGRPQPKTQSLEEMKEKYSLEPVAGRLAELLGASFAGFVGDCVGAEVEAAVRKLLDGQVLLLENTRFHAGETKNDPKFAEQLAALAEVYVDDAFGVAHRAQASVTAVVPFFQQRYAGLLLRAEVQYLTENIWSPVRPLGVALGGAKVADKIGVLWALIEIADKIVIGGRMAFTFLAATGVAVGQTQIEADWIEPAQRMIETAAAKGVELVLPVDVIVTESLEGGVPVTCVPLTTSCCSNEAPCIPHGCFGADIGPASSQLFEDTLKSCRTIFWNGPMGKFEVDEFAAGTRLLAKAIAASTAAGAVTIVGGGDSVAAVRALGLEECFSHVSSGGGASLELLEGRSMPGIEALAA